MLNSDRVKGSPFSAKKSLIGRIIDAAESIYDCGPARPGGLLSAPVTLFKLLLLPGIGRERRRPRRLGRGPGRGAQTGVGISESVTATQMKPRRRRPGGGGTPGPARWPDLDLEPVGGRTPGRRNVARAAGRCSG